jgi:hypothetical protein
VVGLLPKLRAKDATQTKMYMSNAGFRDIDAGKLAEALTLATAVAQVILALHCEQQAQAPSAQAQTRCKMQDARGTVHGANQTG